MTSTTVSSTAWTGAAPTNRTEVVRIADATHAVYPQYAGHWADERDWILVRIPRDLKTKMGEAFKKGDLTVAQASSRHQGGEFSRTPNRWFILAYSWRNGCDTSIPMEATEEVAYQPGERAA